MPIIQIIFQLPALLQNYAEKNLFDIAFVQYIMIFYGTTMQQNSVLERFKGTVG
jgi:hypothetical protein